MSTSTREDTYDDAVQILDRLDVSTKGGIADLKSALEKRLDEIDARLAMTSSTGTPASGTDSK